MAAPPERKECKQKVLIEQDGKLVGSTSVSPEQIKTVCAWCGKHIHGSEHALHTSHSICHECLQKELGGGG